MVEVTSEVVIIVKHNTAIILYFILFSFIAPVLKTSLSGDTESITPIITCTASCLTNFIVWIANYTLPNDHPDDVHTLYRKSSNKSIKCNAHSHMYNNNTSSSFSETLHFSEALKYPTLFTCASLFLCTKEEADQNCPPRMCYSN